MPRPVNMERRAAFVLNESRYKGKRCKRGHNGWRYTANAACCQCQVDRDRKHRDAQPAGKKQPTRRVKPAGLPVTAVADSFDAFM